MRRNQGLCFRLKGKKYCVKKVLKYDDEGMVFDYKGHRISVSNEYKEGDIYNIEPSGYTAIVSRIEGQALIVTHEVKIFEKMNTRDLVERILTDVGLIK